MKQLLNIEDVIEKFVLDDLTKNEEIYLDKQLRANPELNKTLEFNKKLIHSIQKTHLIEFRKQLTRARREMLFGNKNTTIHTKNKPALKLIYKIAASVIILIAAGWIIQSLFFSTITPDELYATYYEPYPAEFISRSTHVRDEINNKLLSLYEQKQYKQIVDNIIPSLHIEENDNYLCLLIGISYMETGQFENAKIYFRKILNHPKNIYYRDAEWYMVFCHARLNAEDQARTLLNKIKNSNSPYAQKAKKLARRF